MNSYIEANKAMEHVDKIISQHGYDPAIREAVRRFLHFSILSGTEAMAMWESKHGYDLTVSHSRSGISVVATRTGNFLDEIYSASVKATHKTKKATNTKVAA